MKKYYEQKGAEFDSVITTRFQLISSDLTLNTELALLENADASRIVSSEEVVENKYRYLLNRYKCSSEVKVKAVLNFSKYLVAHKNKLDKALKLYEDYYPHFDKNPIYIKHYARYSWAEGSDEYRAQAIDIIQKYLQTKPKIETEYYVEILGLLMMYSSIIAIKEREELKDKFRYQDISKKEYDKFYAAQKERFKELYKYPGLKLFGIVKSISLNKMEPEPRHSTLEGLSHFVEICMRNVKLSMGKEVCQHVLDNLPQNFQKPFIFKLSKIDVIENPKRKVDPYKKTETEFGEKLKQAFMNE